MILVDGEYDGAPEGVRAEIDRWVRRGGVLVALQRAARWVDRRILGKGEGEKPGQDDERSGNGEARSQSTEAGKVTERRAYVDAPNDRAERLISGSIFEVELDLSHPLAFGYSRQELSVFRNGRVFLDAPEDPYTTVAVYSESPLVSGYISDENLERLSASPAMAAQRHGQGAVVRMADGPNFRAFWYGTNKLFLNTLFFGAILDDTSSTRRRESHHAP